MGEVMKTIYFVIPCYNEEEVLAETARQLTLKIESLISSGKISTSSKVMLVDDGSKDSTWSLIQDLVANNKHFTGLKLSRNRGHQNALLAGLLTAKEYADAVISLDADLQDDIGVIDDFIDEYLKGFEVIYGVRASRETDSAFKRVTAQTFYKLMHALGAEIIYNHADYRLMSKRALEALEEFKETNLFLRGLVPLVGFKSTKVMYRRNERFAGESKYPLKKMLGFAADGILSFSIKPIRMITICGVFVFIVSILMLIYFVTGYFLGKTVPGWTTIVVSTWALGGLNLLALGVVGEYIGKIYLESKHRPKFIIEDYIENDVCR